AMRSRVKPPKSSSKSKSKKFESTTPKAKKPKLTRPRSTPPKLTPSGSPRVPSPREYPDRPIVGVGAVIIDRSRVLLIKRGSPPLKGEWSLPGGVVELGDTL